jgi:hypothetical protein
MNAEEMQRIQSTYSHNCAARARSPCWLGEPVTPIEVSELQVKQDGSITNLEPLMIGLLCYLEEERSCEIRACWWRSDKALGFWDG